MNVVLANIYPFRPGETVGPHASASNLLLISLRGRGRVDLPDGVWEPAAGDVLHLPWNCPRWYRAATEEPFTLIGVHRAAESEPPAHQSVPSWACRDSVSIMGEQRHDHEGQLRHALERIVTWFVMPPSAARSAGLAAWSAVVDAEWQPLTVSSAAAQRLGAVASWMRLNHGRSITRGDLAQRAGLAESTFAAAFRDAYGMPPMQYLIALRLAHARELLTTTTDPIPQVAAACGFPDPPHFSRLFKRHSNETATAFRRSRRML